jgi:hypothetical protein
MNRDGTRMKFMPGSQYTNGKIPKGGPDTRRSAIRVRSA